MFGLSTSFSVWPTNLFKLSLLSAFVLSKAEFFIIIKQPDLLGLFSF